MRLGHFRRVFSPLTETFIYDYVRETDAQGAQSHVVCFQRVNEDSRPWPLVHQVEPASAPLRKLMRLPSQFGLGKNWQDARPDELRGLLKMMRKLSPQVVHAHFGPDAVLVAEAAASVGAPLIVSHHGYDISILLRDPQWRQRYDRLWSLAARITVVSEFQRQRLLQMGLPADKVTVVRVGKRLEEYRFHPPRGPLQRLVSVGRFVEKKAQRDAIAAVAAYNEGQPQALRVELRLAGDGPLLDAAKQLVRERGWGESITFLGAIPHAQVVEEMTRADAFILPSKVASNGDEEGVPTVLMEAQAMGLPCLSTTHTGIPEVIPTAYHDQLLAPEGDVDALTENLRQLAEASPKQRLAIAEAGRARVEEEFDLRHQCARLITIYEDSNAPFSRSTTTRNLAPASKI